MDGRGITSIASVITALGTMGISAWQFDAQERSHQAEVAAEVQKMELAETARQNDLLEVARKVSFVIAEKNTQCAEKIALLREVHDASRGH